ncbi:hypothetical protein FRC11_003738, partial [Ceratobasidium sp. 423]
MAEMLLSVWQGGKQSVPWKAVAHDTRNRYVASQCFPPGIDALIDPGNMNRAQLETWYRWIISGQEGKLNPEQVFQFLLVDAGANHSPIVYINPIVSRPPQCCLTWSPQEKTYVLKVATAAHDALQQPTWNGLPPARLEQVYEPFSALMKIQMSNACQAEYKAAAIMSLVFAIERYGPVHTHDVSIDEPLNRYIPEDTSNKSIEELLLQDELRPSALLEDDPLYTELSLMSFIRYAKTT